jgi:hypothetical protein
MIIFSLPWSKFSKETFRRLVPQHRQSFVDGGYTIKISLLLRHPGESRGPEKIYIPGFRFSPE